ncbi:MAG: DUF933 domain-containing protein [Elusimicrobiota bacterium]
MIAGIIGLPNAGKSALFNLLTSNSVPSSAYPYCTVEPNEGVAFLKDSRMEDIKKMFPGAVISYPSIKLVDVAGLPPGASRGEGLGNQFLGHIREADSLVHVVRAFKSGSVAGPATSSSSPDEDIELVETELFLSDLQIVERRLKENPQSKYYKKTLQQLKNKVIPEPDEENVLLTPKPQIIVLNITSGAAKPSITAQKVIYIDVLLQRELQLMEPEERKEFINEIPKWESSVEDVLFEIKKLLGLVTFFTATGGKEIKGYNVPAGTGIQKAAGKVHTDMEKGFIRAKVYNYSDIALHGFSLEELKKNAKERVEGKDYKVRDGDIVEILFS